MLRRLALVAAAAVAAACPSGGEPAGRTFAVRTARATRRDISETLVSTGSLAANAEVSLRSKVAGRLAATRLDGGENVREGTRARALQVLAEIDDREWSAKVDAAKASVAAAEAEAADAGREFVRAGSLRAANAISESEHDAALARRDRAAAALAEARSALKMAQLDLEECAVRAPFDGVVTRKSSHPGAILTVSDEIYGFASIDPVEAVFDVPTAAMPLLKAGKTRVRVAVDAYPGEPLDLVVAEVFPVADPDTRTVRVKALVPNPDGRYLPGMFATATFALDERSGVLVLPFEAVLKIQGRRCVYKVQGGKAVLADVETGLRHDEVQEIVSGISEDDEIVVDGIHRLCDGASVSVVE
ncbi:MAG: efflux RND transporter periplasmic adaptor subunit [Kiritimatiellae bacterium]|nr:efflux RND transporter periplasmic adaptor subunit [Kiritimatiellia bacterium]